MIQKLSELYKGQCTKGTYTVKNTLDDLMRQRLNACVLLRVSARMTTTYCVCPANGLLLTVCPDKGFC